ncbi:MAG: hypothetical protein JO030_03630 [Candidatus Eremiobacteraeota bacterium]|nr:hypothetical protein [Candidatus Eremiobacteraeota bacterium]
MARRTIRIVACAIGLLLTACAGGGVGPLANSYSGADGLQTVSDAADALDAQRASASDNAKTAIAVADALGSVVRDLGRTEQRLSYNRPSERNGADSLLRKRVISASEIILRRGFGNVAEFCQSSAGYSLIGIPSLDVTFGWESGAFSGGSRWLDERGFAIWSAHTGGSIVQAPIGALWIRQDAGSRSCPMSRPMFTLSGGGATEAFSIPITLVFHRGRLSSINVLHGAFSGGESLDVSSTTSARQSVQVSGTVRNGRTKVATFRTNAAGDGTLTITSTGAQYAIADWIVVGI